jgi:lipopolysaccharide export system protein LptA
MRAFFRLTKPAAPLLALIALSAFTPAQAQTPAKAKATEAPAAQGPTLLPGSSSHEPINIAADKLDYFDKQQKAVYTGNVVAIQGETRLNATELTILFDKKADAKSGDAKPESKPEAKSAVGPGAANSQMRRMEGKGPIAITNKDQVGTGDSLVFDKPENKFYLIGNVALSQGENVTRGDKLIYDLNTGQAVVTSKGRVHSLIVPGDQPKPGTSAPGKPGH